jgi:2-polyprenyl-6-methoxyphenol hydroxylase-like FAD-dependent oxidoreductase
VVLVGGGFGGLAAGRALRNAPVRVTLIDRCNHHLFQPLLRQIATASLAALTGSAVGGLTPLISNSQKRGRQSRVDPLNAFSIESRKELEEISRRHP